MATALLIASLALLVGMISQLALLPRRQRAHARPAEQTSVAPGGTAHGTLAVADQAPEVH